MSHAELMGFALNDVRDPWPSCRGSVKPAGDGGLRQVEKSFGGLVCMRCLTIFGVIPAGSLVGHPVVVHADPFLPLPPDPH